MNLPDDRTLDAWADHLDPQTRADSRADPVITAAERTALDAVAARLRDDALWSDPPPQLKAALLAEVTAQQRERAVPARPPARRSRASWLVAAAAVAAIVVGGAVIWPRNEPVGFTMTGTALAPRAHAEAELEPKSAGVAIRLNITGLKAAPPGTFYAAWLRGSTGVVPVGTFHWRKGGIPIDLWSGVGTDRYPELFVTLQREGAPPEPSDQVVLDGRAG